jgi:hypothetical protein
MKKSVQPEMYEYVNGDKDWRLGNTLHRTDGPAIEYAAGGKEWWLHGTLHRTDGPAIECADGRPYWWLHNSHYTFDQWLAKTTGLTDEEKVMYKLEHG